MTISLVRHLARPLERYIERYIEQNFPVHSARYFHGIRTRFTYDHSLDRLSVRIDFRIVDCQGTERVYTSLLPLSRQFYEDLLDNGDVSTAYSGFFSDIIISTYENLLRRITLGDGTDPVRLPVVDGSSFRDFFGAPILYDDRPSANSYEEQSRILAVTRELCRTERYSAETTQGSNRILLSVNRMGPGAVFKYYFIVDIPRRLLFYEHPVTIARHIKRIVEDSQEYNRLTSTLHLVRDRLQENVLENDPWQRRLPDPPLYLEEREFVPHHGRAPQPEKRASKGAEKKAEKFLEEYLSPVQLEQWKRSRKQKFLCIGGSTGTIYQVNNFEQINVYEFDETGTMVQKLCAVPADPLPLGDHLLAVKLMLETDEEGHLAIAKDWVPDNRLKADPEDIKNIIEEYESLET